MKEKIKYSLFLAVIFSIIFNTSANSIDIADKLNVKVPQTKDEILSKRITHITTIELTDDEIKIFEEALQSVAKIYIKDNKHINAPKVNIVYTHYGKATIYLEQNKERKTIELGGDIDVIIYPIQTWRDLRVGKQKMQEFIVEELVHHFWNKEDGEPSLREKIDEIMNEINNFKAIPQSNATPSF